MRILNTEINSSEEVVTLAKQVMLDNTRFERLQIIGDLKNEYVKRGIKIDRQIAEYDLTFNKDILQRQSKKCVEAQFVRELYEELEKGEVK